MVALTELSPLSQFLKRFHQAVNYTWREFLVMDDHAHGVIQNEKEDELDWSRSRPLRMVHAFDPVDQDKLDAIISHYGVERVSAAKDW